MFLVRKMGWTVKSARLIQALVCICPWCTCAARVENLLGMGAHRFPRTKGPDCERKVRGLGIFGSRTCTQCVAWVCMCWVIVAACSQRVISGYPNASVAGSWCEGVVSVAKCVAECVTMVEHCC